MQVIDLTGFDLDREATRQIREFPFYKTRLAPIDYEAIIRQGDDWKDPNFKPVTSSLIDDSMMRSSRHTAWTTLVWKRPSEVYGPGNFAVYVEPGPNDI